MCVHKAWNLKYDKAEMTTAANEGCIGWLLENCYLMGKKETFDSERFKSIKEDFSDGGNEQLFDCWAGFPPIPRVSHKGSGEGWGTVHTWRMQQPFDIFGKKGDQVSGRCIRYMILGDNPAGHCFVLRDLVLIELVQRSHNCVTWMHAAGINFVNLSKSY